MQELFKMKHSELEVGDAVFPARSRKNDLDIKKGEKPWGIVVGKPRSNIYTVMWNHGRSYSNHMRVTLVKKNDLESHPRFTRWCNGQICANSSTNVWYSDRISMRDDFSTPMQRRPGRYDEVETGLSIEKFFKEISKIDNNADRFRGFPTELSMVRDWYKEEYEWKVDIFDQLRIRKHESPALPKEIDPFNPFKEQRSKLDQFLSEHSRRRR